MKAISEMKRAPFYGIDPKTNRLVEPGATLVVEKTKGSNCISLRDPYSRVYTDDGRIITERRALTEQIADALSLPVGEVEAGLEAGRTYTF